MEEPVTPKRRGNRTVGVVALGVLLIALIGAAAIVALHNSFAKTALQSVGHGYGYDIAAQTLDINLSAVHAGGVRITNVHGEPVFEARHVDISYSLRDLLPGGSRLFGLKSVTLDAPHVTAIHHADGTYNITLPSSSGQPAKPSTAVLDIALHVSGGAIDLVDRFVAAPHERRERIVDIAADGAISPTAPARYHAGAVLVDAGRRYPIVGAARFADSRGFELQHLTAARLPIAALANFALSTHAIVVQAGELDNLDALFGALATASGSMETHFGARAELRDGRLAATALARPVRDAHGSFVLDDDSATIRGLDASLAGLPIHLRGALFNFAAPQVAVALTAHGDLARVRQLSKDIAGLPLGGAIAVQGLVEGPAANPLIFAQFRSPKLNYGAYRFTAPRGFVAVSGQELDVLAARLSYGALDVAARGALQLQAHTRTAGYAVLRAPPHSLPYVDTIIPGIALTADAVVHGTDGRLAARGYLGGGHNADRLDLPFSIAATGSGTLGPLALTRSDGASVYGRVMLDRRTNQTVALIDARALSLLPAPAVALPGLTLPALPQQLNGKLDASVAALARGNTLAAANGAVHAYGSWGDLRAEATGSGRGFAGRGRLTSSFERLAAFTGNIGARGGIDIPFAASNAGAATVVQVANARFAGASIRGVPLSTANATIGIAGRALNVYSADLGIAGRNVTAQGSFGTGGHLHVTAGDIDLAALRGAGIPVANGRGTVIADVGGSLAKPVATVLAALSGARFAGTPVGGDVSLAYDGASLRLDRATLTYGGAYATASGSVAGLTLGHIAPRYNVQAQLEDADIAALARTVKNPLRYPEGTLDADVRIGGAGATPSLAGTIGIPEGSLNGLNFSGGRVALNGTPAAVNASGGQLRVGSTTLAFGGRAARTQQSFRLASRRIDLADFNDYFDEADVLAGVGSVALAADASPARLDTSAHLALSGLRYRRFELGRAALNVSTVGTTVGIRADIAGANGNVGVGGRVNVPADHPLNDIVRRSSVDLNARIAGLNLGNVLPAAGISAPVLGLVDASAVVRGRYPALALNTQAALRNGVIGRLPIDRFSLSASANNGRGRLTDLTVAVPGLNATANGTFGLRPSDAFDLTAQATSADIATLASAATGKNAGFKGALATRTRVTGTLARPVLASVIDVSNLNYQTITISSIHVDVAATRAAVDVRNGTIVLPRSGTIAFDGHAPLSGRPSTPIAFDFAPHNVNVNPYSSLLPDGSVVQGVFDGNVGVRGTLAAPQLSGNLAFANGSYRSNTVKLPLTAIALQLDFAGTSIRVAKLHAHATPGNFDGSGTITLGDLRNPLPGLLANVNLTAHNALVSAPKYYVGYLDGTLAATKTAHAALQIGGNLTASSARIPYTALMPSGGSAQAAAPALPDVNLDLGVTVGRDVRVQSGPVDIGTTGTAQLGGTLAKPTLAGQFNATDGTVSVYRTFVVQNGSAVSFNPSDGITPSVDATAVTHISDPATDVLLHITGLSTHLNLAFSSQPDYSQQQILGLLVNAQALGAVSGVAASGDSASGSSGSAITGIGEGLLNTQFTQKFLQPFSSKLGGALGLSDLNLNYNTNGAVSAVARRMIGKNISFTYGEQIGGPTPRTSIGINVGSAISGAQLTFFQAAGSSQAFGGQALTPYLQSGFLATSSPNYTLQAIEPPTGSGFVFSYQRHF